MSAGRLEDGPDAVPVTTDDAGQVVSQAASLPEVARTFLVRQGLL